MCLVALEHYVCAKGRLPTTCGSTFTGVLKIDKFDKKSNLHRLLPGNHCSYGNQILHTLGVPWLEGVCQRKTSNYLWFHFYKRFKIDKFDKKSVWYRLLPGNHYSYGNQIFCAPSTRRPLPLRGRVLSNSQWFVHDWPLKMAFLTLFNHVTTWEIDDVITPNFL